MSRVTDMLLLAAASIVGLELYQRYTGVSLTKTVSTLRLQMAGVTFEPGAIDININVQNPSSNDLTIKSFVGNMYAGGQPVAIVQMFGDYVIKGNSQRQIPLIAKPKVLSLWQAAWQGYLTGTRVDFQGTINVNDKPIPLTMSYTTD